VTNSSHFRKVVVHVAAMGLLFIMALTIRLAFLQANHSNVFMQRDAGEYLNYARNLAYFNVFSKAPPGIAVAAPDAFRSPGYPLLLSLVLRISGEHRFLENALTIQQVTGALLTPLTYALGVFFLHPAAAVTAGLLTAFSPHLISVGGCILSETLFAFCLLAGLCAFQWAIRGTVRVLPVSALLFGCAYLVNETALCLPFIIAAIIRWRINRYEDSDYRRAMKRGLRIFVLVFAIFPCVWMFRSHVLLPPGAARGADRAIATLSHGAYPGFIYKTRFFMPFPYREDPQQPEFGSSMENFTRILWQRAKAEPWRYVSWYFFEKPFYLWRWSIIQGKGDAYIYPVNRRLEEISPLLGVMATTMRLLHPWLMVTAALALPLLLFKRRTETCFPQVRQTLSPQLVLIPLLYFTLLYMVFAPWPRYSIPLRPQFYLCAAWSLAILTSMIQGLFSKHRVESSISESGPFND